MATTFQGGPGKAPAQRAGPPVVRVVPAVSRQAAGAARIEVASALMDGRRRAGADPRVMLALQRQAGNAAVGALMAAKLKSPGEQAVSVIDAALKEIRTDQPAIGTVEKGLQAAKTAGVPVELEGPKPPAAALAVTKTGFGPGSVPAKKPAQPPKQVPALSPLGKAGAAKMQGQAKGSAAGQPAAAGGGAAAPAMPVPLALPADKLLQPPVAPVPVRPEEDPGFAQVAGAIKGVAQSRKAHPPAAAKAQEAQSAALPPTDDVAGQAKAAKVDAMDAQQPGTFDKQAFIAAVKAAIESKSPKTLEEADEYKKSGKAGQAKGEVKGLVSQGKEGQAKDIEAATEAPPDQSKAVPKPVTPMAQEQAGQAPAVTAVGAAPKPAPADQVNLAAGPQQANQEMADADVSEQQLAQSNEPEFQQGLKDKQAAAEHAQAAPAEYRQQEQQVLQQGKAEAGAVTAGGVSGMQNAKASALAKLAADKGKTKSKDETRRAEVTAKVQAIFAATEADVKKTLDGIDPEVDKEFETGEAGARAAFEAYVEAKMSAYKKDRYGGWLGGYRWLRDKIAGMPPKVNEFYEAGRELYLSKMNGVISRVADIVGRALTGAKQRIAKGRAEISTYVAGLPSDLQKVGADATKEIGDKFEALEGDVNAKQESVVDALATKYVEAGKGLNDRIEALQAENKGLVDKAIGALKAIINTIRELAGMLKNVLSRAAGVVGDIIKNPVAFLGNLIEGVKGGILKFKDNILGHLKKGLMGWLFGALAEGGVELPETFDLKGIIKLLASIFGLTWANIRNRLVKQIGEPAMAAVEKGVEIFQIIRGQGVAGLWQMLLDKLGNIKDMILEQVKDFVITKIITAGITWLIGLLNPAAAFIKACKLIYDVVMFFVNNAERIMKFVNTIIDSVADIVRGNVSSVVNKIEDVLGQMVPILIGFLASVIGIGGIGQKIRQIIETLQKPVKQALDFVIKTGLKLARPIIRGVKGFAGKVKAGAKKLGQKAKEKLGFRKEGVVAGTAPGQVVAEADCSVHGHNFRGKATSTGVAVAVSVQRTVVPAIPAATASIAAITNPAARDALRKLVQKVERMQQPGRNGGISPTDVVRINALLRQVMQEDVAAAANAIYGASPINDLTAMITEFNGLTAPGARRAAYYMALVSWEGTVTPAIRARDLPRIVQQIQTLGSGWVDGEVNLRGFYEELHDDIHLGSEGTSDERIPGKPKYVPSVPLASFLTQAGAVDRADHKRRGVDRVSRQASLSGLVAAIQASSLWHVDHRVPLARDWNSNGHKQTAEYRARVASDPSNLVLVSGNWNTSKGGEGEVYSAAPAVGFSRQAGGTPATAAAASNPHGLLIPTSP